MKSERERRKNQAAIRKACKENKQTNETTAAGEPSIEQQKSEPTLNDCPVRHSIFTAAKKITP